MPTGFASISTRSHAGYLAGTIRKRWQTPVRTRRRRKFPTRSRRAGTVCRRRAVQEEWRLPHGPDKDVSVRIILAGMPDGTILLLMNDVTERKLQEHRARALTGCGA